MNSFKIALLQIAPTGNMEQNRIKGEEYCRKAAAMGAQLALFPEMWSVGYKIDEDLDRLQRDAITSNSGFVTFFSDLAKELNMAVAVTYLEKRDGQRPRNTVTLFDRHGKRMFDYAKVHTCDFGDECRLSAGDDFYVCDLDTETGTVKVGAMICYDREFPESARILMLKGAEVIIVPNACPMEINRLSQLRGRAYENMTAIATCNYPDTKEDCNGHSSCFDGCAYLPDMDGSRDTCITLASSGEGIFAADIDMGMLRAYRKSEVHGNAYRRPEKYGLLLNKTINEPFIRDDKR